MAESRRTSATFASRVKEAFQVHELGSTRDAAKATGIGHVTLYRMQQGVVPSIATVKKWASAIGELEASWLVWAYGREEPVVGDQDDSVNGSNKTPRNAPETAPSVPPARPAPENVESPAQLQITHPEPPEAVKQAIQNADTNEAKVALAWDYIRRPELGVKIGATGADPDSYATRIALVRHYEAVTGITLLPPEVY